MFSSLKRAIGSQLAGFLSKSLPGYRRLDTVSVEQIAAVLRTGDIVLVEGNTRISTAIKYLTQSSWSHATLFIGESGDSPELLNFVEADLKHGVRLVGLEHYSGLNLRVCRPIGLSTGDKSKLVEFAQAKVGHQYDLRNITDLIRFTIQKPAVPNRYRRALLGLGSGEPTKAICSTLVAETFQSINYPILPVHSGEDDTDQPVVLGEVPRYYKRHFTHFTPRDFDLSPYFQIVKPTIEHGFHYKDIDFAQLDEAE